MKKNAIIAAICFILLAGCAATPQTGEVYIKTAKAAVSDLQSTIEISGALTPNETVTLSAKLSGIVSNVSGEVGDSVAQGDTLVLIDTHELEAQLKQAQASYDSAVSKVAIDKENVSAAKTALSTSRDSVTDQIASAKTNLDAAKKALDAQIELNNIQPAQLQLQIDNAKRTLDRTKLMFELGDASQTDVDNAQSMYDSADLAKRSSLPSLETALVAAQSKYDAALIQYNQATGSSAKSQISAAQSKLDVSQTQLQVSAGASLEVAKAAVDVISAQIANAKVISSISGVIINRNIHTGELATTGTPLITVADINKLKLKGTVSQEALPYLRAGQQVAVQADIYPGKTFTGVLSLIGPMSVSAGTYFPVEITIDNANKDLAAGLSAHASVEISSGSAMTVPSAAVIVDNGTSYVFVVDSENVAHKTEIVTGISNGDMIQVLRGVEEGQTVACSETSTLTDNQPIKVQE